MAQPLFRGQSIVDFYNFTESLVFTEIPSHGRILDIGCGDGRFTWKMANVSDASWVFALDIDPVAIQDARQKILDSRIQFFCHDGEDLTFIQGLGPLDLVFCRLTLHHFRQPQSFLRGLCKLLPKGGKLLVIDIDRESAAAEFFGFPLTVFITFATVIKHCGIGTGFRSIFDMRYGSKGWKDHRNGDLIHRQAIGWYRFDEIRRKYLEVLPGARIGRLGSILGYGGVHYAIFTKK